MNYPIPEYNGLKGGTRRRYKKKGGYMYSLSSTIIPNSKIKTINKKKKKNNRYKKVYYTRRRKYKGGNFSSFISTIKGEPIDLHKNPYPYVGQYQ